MSKLKFRFAFNEDHYIVKAKRKSTGKWEAIGTCHASAKDVIADGSRLELLVWNPSYASVKFAQAKAAMEEMIREDNPDVRVVRHVDRPILGQEKPLLVPLPITDDRNENPDYAVWKDI